MPHRYRDIITSSMKLNPLGFIHVLCAYMMIKCLITSEKLIIKGVLVKCRYVFPSSDRKVCRTMQKKNYTQNCYDNAKYRSNAKDDGKLINYS